MTRPNCTVRICAILLAALTVSCSSPEEKAQQAREEVVEALQRDDQAAARRALEELRKSTPDTPEGLLDLAALLIRSGDAAEAVWLLEKGVARFKDRDELRIALGQSALKVGDAERARRVASAVAESSAQHPDALTVLAQATLMLGDSAGALEIFERAERLYPERLETRTSHIAALVGERRYDDALQAIETARSTLDPDENQEELHRFEILAAHVRISKGETEPALTALLQLVQRDPGDLLAWQLLVRVLLQEGRAAEALELLDSSIARAPDQPALLALRATPLQALGRQTEAEEAFLGFVKRWPTPSAYAQLAEYYGATGRAERVVEVLDEAALEYPDEPGLIRIRAEALIALDRTDEARRAMARLAKVAPDDPAVEYLRARLELHEGRAAAAAARLEKLTPRLDEAATHFWHGKALEAMGDNEGARARHGVAIVRQPEWTPPYLEAIRLTQVRGDWREVAALAQILVARAPGLFDGYAALTDALVSLNDAKNAESVARVGVERFPNRPEAPVLLARALRAGGHHDEALTQLDAAAKRFGDTPELKAQRALTLGIGGRVEEGTAEALAAIARHPAAAPLHVALAALLFQAGAAEEGARAVDRALELAPDDPRPLRLRCRFRAASGLFEGARTDCRRYLQARPDDAEAHFILGAALAQGGRTAEAIAAYRTASRLDPSAFAPRNNLASLLAEQGDLDGALEAAQEAYALASDNPNVLDTLGELYLRKGLVERSISLLEEARTAAPDLSEAQLHLALAYGAAGRADDARRLLADLQKRTDPAGALGPRIEEALHSLD